MAKKTDEVKQIESPYKRKQKKKRIIALCISGAVVLLAFIAILLLMKKTGEEKEKEIMTASPAVHDIVLTVSGSGTVAPYDRYEVVPQVQGDIVSCNYEEGDTVREDDVLYIFDHDEQDKAITAAKNSITKSEIRNKKYLNSSEYQKELAKYTVRATGNGVLTNFDLKADDKVNANVLYGIIQDRESFIATVPFNAAQCEKIAVGDTATVNLFPSMYTCEGRVTYISAASSGSMNGAVVYDVEITVSGVSIALTDTAASATIYTASGSVDSPKSGTIDYKDPVNVMPEVSGTVSYVPAGIKNGATVRNGDILFIIDDSDFKNEKKLAEFDYSDLQISLENAQDRLDNYVIKAPISGTIITKNYKKGDTITGNSPVTLMVIADMSAMKFTFQADETDIDKIAIGQEVEVTADAVTGKTFMGRVTKIATEGVATNGVSYYEVEVVIDNYGQHDTDGALRSGMNVSAEIVYTKELGKLCVPTSAIHSFGGDSYVFVKTESAIPAMKKEKTETDTGKPAAGGASQGKQSEAIAERIAAMVPDGFKSVKVEIGASDGNFTIIRSGITENDIVYLAESNDVKIPVFESSNAGFGSTGGMGGGMGGGGGMPMPHGSFGGGMGGGR